MKFAPLFLCFAFALPAAALNPEAQQALAEELTAKAQKSEIWKDDAGNITGLIFINHQALDKDAPGKPGIDDADLQKLSQFPKLTALNLEAQAVGDEGLAVLSEMPNLKQLGFHYMAKNPKASATADCAALINGKPELEILEIKHNFRMDSFAIEKITTPMPKVWRLVLDTPLSAEQTLHLIRLCPNVTDLQLHRSRCTPEQLVEIGKLLPNLEVLWWKPKGELEAAALEAISGFQNLRIFSPQQFRNQLPFENGWDALLDASSLERIEVAIKDDINGSALKRLLKQKPSLEIDPKLTRSRNYGGL